VTILFDVQRARQETPGCDNVVHFNNAGASLPPTPVLNAVLSHLEREAQIGGYEAEAEAHDSVEHVYDALAALLHCERNEIAVVENATRAWDMLFYAVPLRKGDRILTAQCEYGSNYIAMLQRAKQTGAVIEDVPNDQYGQISVQALREMLDERVKLIAITHVPTNGGLVNPAREVGKVAQQAGVLYLLDACQSVGQMPMDVQAIGCDMLTGTGRKFLRGPRGTGFLYVRHEILDQLEPPFLDMQAAEWAAKDKYIVRKDARRFETWEISVAGKIGLGVAVDYALGWGLEAIEERVTGLAEALRERLNAITRVTVQDQGRKQCGIVTFTVEGVASNVVKERLAVHAINVWTSPCRSTRLDMEARGLEDVVRASVHYYNTEDEIERLCRAVAQLINIF
jgi:cysteine desulfurase/selenocysteine lyase